MELDMCTKLERKAYDKKRYENNKESIKKRNAEWRKNNPQAMRKLLQWQKDNPDKVKETRKRGQARITERVKKWRHENNRGTAHCLVQMAVKQGKLIKLPCEICGNPKSEAHHADYSKPLDVVWVCRKHHRDMHFKKQLE